MRKSELKQLIKECLVEEGLTNSNISAVDVVEEIIELYVDENLDEIFDNISDSKAQEWLDATEDAGSDLFEEITEEVEDFSDYLSKGTIAKLEKELNISIDDFQIDDLEELDEDIFEKTDKIAAKIIGNFTYELYEYFGMPNPAQSKAISNSNRVR
jgi:hypothetical protein